MGYLRCRGPQDRQDEAKIGPIGSIYEEVAMSDNKEAVPALYMAARRIDELLAPTDIES